MVKDLLQKYPSEFRLALENEKAIILEQDALPRAYIMDVQDRKLLDSKLTALMNDPNEFGVSLVESYHLEINGSEEVFYKIQRPAFLVFNENYYPGWTAQIDDKTATIENSFGLRVLQVPEGNHKVIITYKSTTFHSGHALTISSMIIWLILTFYIYKAKTAY